MTRKSSSSDEHRLVTRASAGHTLTQSLPSAPKAPSVDPGSKLSHVFGSPRAIMILVPLLVLALGMTLTIIGQVALGSTSRTMAADRFVAHTRSLTFGLENTLGQAEPLLDELTRIARAAQAIDPPEVATGTKEGKKKKSGRRALLDYEQEELTPIALEMRDLLVGRPGITQAYIAYPDGTFISADPAGSRSVGIQVTQGGRSLSYQVKQQRVHRVSNRKSSYDPRVRNWYKLATAKRERVWSPPYMFFFNKHTGVTRSEAIYAGEDKTDPIAVVGVDFDVNALTAFMAGTELVRDPVHSAVFTLDGVVLAFPRGAKSLEAIQKKEKVPTHQELGDPQLSGLIRRLQDVPPDGRSVIEFSWNSERMLASVRQVGRGGPKWYVATFSPERSVLRELYQHRKSSLAVGLLSLLFAVALAWFLARRLFSMRRAAHLAQAAAQEARDQARDLGSYRLVSRIGEGGMGEVWQASHRLLARQAAIKLIKSGGGSPERLEEQRERFRREAQAIAGLRSRNTIALYDYGVTPEGTLFYVMELLEGIDLNTLVSEHGAQNPERVRRILIQACNSLGEAHQAQLVHRDIKPANVFLSREAEEVDVVKVLDFGLVFQAEIIDESDQAKPGVRAANQREPASPLQDDVTSTQTVPTAPDDRITRADRQLGTPAFMSPEQALGKGTDGRSDLYSLACVAWWLLCGTPPFSADSPVALMVKHVELTLPNLDEMCASPLAPRFRDLLLACLSKSPLERPQSAQELGQRLNELGPLSDEWSDEHARRWWKQNMARKWEDETKFSVPPLRDAVVIPPERVG